MSSTIVDRAAVRSGDAEIGDRQISTDFLFRSQGLSLRVMSVVSTEAPDHLNSAGCVIRRTPDKGRGVFGTKSLCNLDKSCVLKRAESPFTLQLPERSLLKPSSTSAPSLCSGKKSTRLTGNTPF